MQEVLKTKIGKYTLGIWWIGQGGFIFKTYTGKIIMVDPYLSFSMEGVTYIHKELPFSADCIQADYVFCTHDHIDHTDGLTLQQIASVDRKTRFFGPSPSARRMIEAGINAARVQALVLAEKVKLVGEIGVEVVHSEHTPPNSFGYIFDFNGILAYCTGDMNVGLDNYIHKMTRVKGLRPDILLICINPGFGNFGPWEAARFTKFVEPRMVIPMHYNLIEENTVDPQLFLNALVQQQVEAIPVVMGYGGKYIYRKG